MKDRTLKASDKVKMILSLGYNRYRQIDASLAWLRGFIEENNSVCIKFPKYNECFYFPFPILPGSYLTKVGDLGLRAAFTITPPRISSTERICLYSSINMEILEQKPKKESKYLQPLRFGLSEEEKELVLGTARRTLGILLKENRSAILEDFDLPSRFYSKTNVVITLWLGKGICGARLSRNSHLGKGVIDATIAAAKDNRFENVKKEDIDEIRIQATLFGSIRVPLTSDEIKQNMIFRNLGYEMHFKSKIGIFLPHVLKLRPPKDLSAYMAHLAHEKVGIPDVLYDINKTQIFTFGVSDFIENEKFYPTPFVV